MHATNFFNQQETARKNTRYLVVLFICAVFCLIAITNLFLFIFPWEWHFGAFAENGANHNLMCALNEQCRFWQHINWRQMLFVSALISTVIVIVCCLKWLQIRQGGKAVAKMMGASLVSGSSQNFLEQRLLNVVEEMAIASNMPVPEVYVLRSESGINAFAAGFSSRDAIVAVTQGALESFNRAQLQAVIAHEFSHILNGDMRLNMKLIATLAGIVFITQMGWVFFRTGNVSRRDRNSAPVALLGLGLIVIGGLGTFFANLIKAAVSRQREFLADASAVQFTRNPQAIADALKIIGGSYQGSAIENEHNREISHFFFSSSIVRMFTLFATHPPLQERIRRIEPYWDGEYLAVEKNNNEEAAEKTAADKLHKEQIVASVLAAATIQSGQAASLDPKQMMLNSLHEPLTAAAILLCLVCNAAEQEQRPILQKLQQQWPQLYEEVQKHLWMRWSGEDFLPIVYRAVVGLRALEKAQYKSFQQFLLLLIQADNKVELYEWTLYQLITHSMAAHFDSVVLKSSKYKKITDVVEALDTVLVVLIQASNASEQDKQLAWQNAHQVAGFTPQKAYTQIFTMAEFSQAVSTLARVYPLVKPRVIKALIEAAKADGHVECIERQCILAISAAIDAPMPDVLLNELGAAVVMAEA